MSGSSHWSRFSLCFISSSNCATTTNGDHTSCVRNVYSITCSLFTKERSQCYFQKKKTSAQYCSCYIDFFFVKAKREYWILFPRLCLHCVITWDSSSLGGSLISEMSFEEPKQDIFSNLFSLPLVWRIKNILNMGIWKLLMLLVH